MSLTADLGLEAMSNPRALGLTIISNPRALVLKLMPDSSKQQTKRR